jgi:hypothetical protein
MVRSPVFSHVVLLRRHMRQAGWDVDLPDGNASAMTSIVVTCPASWLPFNIPSEPRSSVAQLLCIEPFKTSCNRRTGGRNFLRPLLVYLSVDDTRQVTVVAERWICDTNVLGNQTGSSVAEAASCSLGLRRQGQS